MIAELICVGTELLMGQILNTNAQFISKELAPRGIDLYHQLVVGDNPARLTEAVNKALARADVVILSGGLGPTDDDLTKETVCAAMGKPLVLFENEWQKIVGYFEEKGRLVSDNNKKQAMFPEDAIILDNPNGTAPGCIIEKDGKAAILMPGPPRELQPMFINFVLPYLDKRSNHILYSREVRIFGMGEADVAFRLRELFSGTNPTVAPYVKTGEVTLRITARCSCREEGLSMVTPVIEKIRDILGDFVYSIDGETLPMVCHKALIEKGLTLSVAESCTGGLLSSAFIDLPDSSKYFVEGAITYSNEAKIRRLGVKDMTLKRFGAVSIECAIEMAAGMKVRAGTDLAIATTGIAGPSGGTADKPVGLVYVALATNETIMVNGFQLFGDRDRIRLTAVLNALDMLRRNMV
ncbi:MAG: competence/damage-inducible protein A [Clostridia bacterium]|nr:competence/damage-inducible protein A [Clostridia bacterium]